MIELSVDTRSATVTETELLTKGSVGIQAHFSFSSDWDDLIKIAVFRTGEDDEDTTSIQLTSTHTCYVPWERLMVEDEILFIGVYGQDNYGRTVIPTIWASAGAILPGVSIGNEAIPFSPRQVEYLQSELVKKQDKVGGKGLSSNDYTDAEKAKLAGVETGANKTIVDSVLSGTSNNPVQNRVVKGALDEKVNISDVDAVLSETSEHPIQNKTVQAAVASLEARNVFTDAEKTKLAGIEEEANKTVIDSELDVESENPVQNKVLAEQFAALQQAMSTPLIAEVYTDMTDTSKVYVYTGLTTTEEGVTYTNGHWYSYIAATSKWADGGVYQASAISTDDTLTVEDAAADAKATGDAIASTKAITAPAYSTSGVYAVGDYVTYSGALYRCTTAIASPGEAWNSAHWAACKVGTEISDLKSAFINNNSYFNARIIGGENNYGLTWNSGYIKSSDGSIGSSGNYRYSDPIYVLDGEAYSLTFSAGTSNTHFAIAMYDGTSENANISKSVAGGSSKTSFTGTIPAGIKYIRICTQNVVTATLTITPYSLKDARDSINTIEPEIEILQDNDDALLKDKYAPVMTTETMNLSVGYLSTGGVFNESTPTATQRTTDFVAVTPGILYKIEAKNIYGIAQDLRWISLYKADKSFSRDISSGSDLTNKQFTTSGVEYYVRVNTNFNEGDPSVYNIYPDGWQNGTKELNDTLEVPQVEVKKQPDLLHFRRPIISFILDGFKNMNQDMIDIFENHGYKVGIAPGYQEYTAVDTELHKKNVYNARQWAASGHEILSHGSVVIQTADDVVWPDSPTYTEQEGAAMIKAAYTVPASYGFDPKGYIASHGAMSSVFFKYVKAYFSWGALASNREGSQVPYHLFPTSDPYLSWRYSMQLSTLDQMKNAVDTAIANGGLLMFYGHAESQSLGYFTTENLDALLTYIDSYVSNLAVTVKTPFEAMKDYYTIRYWDVVN